MEHPDALLSRLCRSSPGRVLKRPELESDSSKGKVRSGFRAAFPFGIASFSLAVSYGLVAEPVIGAVPAIVFSLVVFAGAAQFAAVTVLAAGGDAVTAIAAGALLNSRFVPMSLAATPSMPEGTGRRALMAQTITDPGWAISARAGGRFDAPFMVGAGYSQYLFWQTGTVMGVLLGGMITDPLALGVDALYPAFFLALLLGGELRRDATGIAVAALGGLIALTMVPVAPPGIPLVLASLAALAVLARPRRKASRSDE